MRSEVFDSGNINNYIKFIIESFRVIDEMQSEKSKLDKLDIWNNIDFIKKFIDGWLDGVDISELRKMWESYKSEYTADRMNVFIEELLAYKFLGERLLLTLSLLIKLMSIMIICQI